MTDSLSSQVSAQMSSSCHIVLTICPFVQQLGTPRPSKGPQLTWNQTWLHGCSWGVPGIPPLTGQEEPSEGTRCVARGLAVGQAPDGLVSVQPPPQGSECSLNWLTPSLLKPTNSYLTDLQRGKKYLEFFSFFNWLSHSATTNIFSTSSLGCEIYEPPPWQVLC